MKNVSVFALAGVTICSSNSLFPSICALQVGARVGRGFREEHDTVPELWGLTERCLEKMRSTRSQNKRASVFSVGKHTHRPMETERSERLFLARVVREGFVEPLIFEPVLELGRVWTGGQCGAVGEVGRRRAFQA